MTTSGATPADQIRRFVALELLRDEDVDLRADEPLFSSGLLDSFAVTPLILFLEDHFGITIPASEVAVDDFDTVDRMLGLVCRWPPAAK